MNASQINELLSQIRSWAVEILSLAIVLMIATYALKQYGARIPIPTPSSWLQCAYAAGVVWLLRK